MSGEMETEILLENRELFEKRPDCWEFILTVDRLERPLEEIIREADAVIPAPSSSPHVPVIESVEIMQINLSVISSSIEALGSLMESRLSESWGPPGQPGTVEAIERVCDEILSCCKKFAAAERAILTTPIHPKLVDVRNKFRGLASENISRLLEVIKSIGSFIASRGTGKLNFNLHLTTERLLGIVIPDLNCIEGWDAGQVGEYSAPASRGCRELFNLFFGWVFLLLGLLFISLYWPFGLFCLFFSLLSFASAEAAGKNDTSSR